MTHLSRGDITFQLEMSGCVCNLEGCQKVAGARSEAKTSVSLVNWFAPCRGASSCASGT